MVTHQMAIFATGCMCLWPGAYLAGELFGGARPNLFAVCIFIQHVSCPQLAFGFFDLRCFYFGFGYSKSTTCDSTSYFWTTLQVQTRELKIDGFGMIEAIGL